MIAKLWAQRGVACLVEDLVKESEPRNRMREIFTYGSVGGAPGNRCFYLELDQRARAFFRWFTQHFHAGMLSAT